MGHPRRSKDKIYERTKTKYYRVIERTDNGGNRHELAIKMHECASFHIHQYHFTNTFLIYLKHFSDNLHEL